MNRQLPKSMLVAAAGTLLLSTASCSGGSSHHPATPVLGGRFSSRVIALCQDAMAQKKAEPPFPFPTFNPTAPEASKLPAIGRYERRGVEIFQTWLQRMQSLGTPTTGAADWAALLDALRAHTQIIADQQVAAQRHDVKTFTKDFFAGNHAQDQMVRAAQAAGVPICATAAGA